MCVCVRVHVYVCVYVCMYVCVCVLCFASTQMSIFNKHSLTPPYLAAI